MPATIEQSQYGFDRNSRRTWQRHSLTNTQDQHYSYDALSQVSAAARGSLNLNATAISGVPAAAESWDYDPTGNWRGYYSAVNGSTTLDQHRVHDRGNRLTQIEDNPHNMILDRVGRMRQMAPDADGDWDGKLELTWDAWSRITRVKNNGEVVGEYAYDGTHRRTTREVGSDTLHSYYNDAWRPVEERKDAETTASISYLWGSRHRDDLVRRDRAVGGTSLNETRYVLMDYFNPAALTDASGVVKERYAFSAFGLRTILNPNFTGRSTSECAMEFAFQGQFLDTESGLMNYGFRYYSPQLGRWTCKDPIEEEGGVNLYTSSSNDASNRVDYLGLSDNLIPVDVTIVPFEESDAYGKKLTDKSEADMRHMAAKLPQSESVLQVVNIADARRQLKPCSCIRNLNIEGHGNRGIQVVGSVKGKYNAKDNLLARRGKYFEPFEKDSGKKADGGYEGFQMFEDVTFCNPCHIILRGCWVGQDEEFVQAVANATGCLASAYKGGTCSLPIDKKSNSLRAHPPDNIRPDVNKRPMGKANLQPYLK